MILIHGVYRFRPRTTAFRNDFCARCKAPRTAIRVTRVDVLHVFWVPLLPLGRHGRWFCSVCGQRPDVPRTARRPVKLLAAVVLAALAFVAWIVPLRDPPDSEELVAAWAMRLAFSAAFIATLRWIAAGSDDVERRKQLKSLPPNRAVECPRCHVALESGPRWRCPVCGMARV